ncbi:MAG: FGGY-family carbohydrate kinase [Faecalibacterium prausnitzii]
MWDSDARGVFFGMSLSTDYGAFVRAIMEGVALYAGLHGNYACCQKSISPIPLGGGAGNSVWCQIFADVLNHIRPPQERG